MRTCPICSHALLHEIDAALLQPDLSIDAVARDYCVDVLSLKIHALLHTPDETGASLGRKLKLREADMLTITASEYLQTLVEVGVRIKSHLADIGDPDASIRFEKLLTPAVVQLYLGTGSEVRNTVKALAELDQLLNGEQNSTSSGLQALALAINRSKPVD